MQRNSMKLKEYVLQYHKSVTKYAAKMDLSSAIVWQYFSGTRRPSQETAERIEVESGGRVTVAELRAEDSRGKDDGIRKPQ